VARYGRIDDVNHNPRYVDGRTGAWWSAGWGRGLDFLLSGGPEVSTAEILQVELGRIRPNPFQPRRDFRPEDLEELAASIREHGVLQPIIVRQVAEWL